MKILYRFLKKSLSNKSMDSVAKKQAEETEKWYRFYKNCDDSFYRYFLSKN